MPAPQPFLLRTEPLQRGNYKRLLEQWVRLVDKHSAVYGTRIPYQTLAGIHCINLPGYANRITLLELLKIKQQEQQQVSIDYSAAEYEQPGIFGYQDFSFDDSRKHETHIWGYLLRDKQWIIVIAANTERPHSDEEKDWMVTTRMINRNLDEIDEILGHFGGDRVLSNFYDSLLMAVQAIERTQMLFQRDVVEQIRADREAVRQITQITSRESGS
ncbi:MAG: hypothetical protein CEN89_689 [Candidatus Berkelbacteria bacterium Licking1014_7]|uniref:Uncharacterized protein n=1 Tax=Candidatus Berkelbacteria bacterium Licking1014_7 TaxID=2017147 RepID=A0A554LHU8_9BACT|nr:MAG: hypothetical protein CEN89_689 [Candidatus Berkelbacteria bacterium Licking1014_7]